MNSHAYRNYFALFLKDNDAYAVGFRDIFKPNLNAYFQ